MGLIREFCRLLLFLLVLLTLPMLGRNYQAWPEGRRGDVVEVMRVSWACRDERLNPISGIFSGSILLGTDLVYRMTIKYRGRLGVFAVSKAPLELAIIDLNGNGRMDYNCLYDCPLMTLFYDNSTYLVQVPSLNGDGFLSYLNPRLPYGNAPLYPILSNINPYVSMWSSTLDRFDLNGDMVLIDEELEPVGVYTGELSELLSGKEVKPLWGMRERGIVEVNLRRSMKDIGFYLPDDLRADGCEPVEPLGYAKTLNGKYLKIWVYRALTFELVGFEPGAGGKK